MKRQAERFRLALAATGMTRDDFAKMIGRSPRQVDRWLKGVREIPKYAWTIVRDHKKPNTLD